MAVRQPKRKQDSSAAAFARSWAAVAQSLTPALARQVLRVNFPDADRTRMHDLAERNSAGKLSAKEADELDGFIRAGDMIAILHSAARRRLKSTGAGANGHE